MKRESRNDQLPVAHFVTDYAAQNDTRAKSQESCAHNVPKLAGGEAKLTAPVVENAITNAHAHARGENRHKACDQQAFGIWGDGYVADFYIAHRFGLMAVGLTPKIGQLHDLTATHGGLMRANSCTGPID